MNKIATEKGFVDKSGSCIYKVFRGFSKKSQAHILKFKETKVKDIKSIPFSGDVFKLTIPIAKWKNISIKVEKFREIILSDKNFTKLEKVLAKDIFYNRKKYENHLMIALNKKLEFLFVPIKKIEFLITKYNGDLYDSDVDNMLFLADDNVCCVVLGNYDKKSYDRLENALKKSRIKKVE